MNRALLARKDQEADTGLADRASCRTVYNLSFEGGGKSGSYRNGRLW
ncbi:MAG: hypothetical protein ACLTBV_16970 [Enterocloster bolteae]